MAPSHDLSETEQLILSYIRSHPPEECMLDKISMGTGKSRATVLKYLGTLHAKGVLDYRHIGRSKLWILHEPPGTAPEIEIRTGREPSPAEVPALAALAFELAAIRSREADLTDRLDHPEMIVITVVEDLRITFKNRLFCSLFPESSTLRELLRPAEAERITSAMRTKAGESSFSLKLDLREKSGVYRPYRITVFPARRGDPPRCMAIVGEDLSGANRSRRHLEALLYIIRTAGDARDEAELMREAMTGVKDQLLPYLHCAVFMADMRIAYSTFPVTDDLKAGLTPFVARSMSSLESAAAGENDPATGLLIAATKDVAIHTTAVVPIIDEEQALGAILLALESGVTTTEIENVEIVADEISTALKMQLLDSERAEYVNTLLAMNRIAGILSDARDETSILEQSIESAMNSLGFEMGCVYLRDEDEEMTARVHRNMPERLRNLCISGTFSGLFERAFTEKGLIYITADMPEYAELDPAITAYGVRTLLILPIKISGEVVGLLNMGSRTVKPYLSTSLNNLSSIGLQLGVALERSRLAVALEKRQRNMD